MNRLPLKSQLSPKFPKLERAASFTKMALHTKANGNFSTATSLNTVKAKSFSKADKTRAVSHTRASGKKTRCMARVSIISHQELIMMANGVRERWRVKGT